MNKIILSVKDRVMLVNILNSMEFDRLGATTLRSVQRTITFSQDEIKDIDMRNSGDGLAWNAKKGVDREFEFTDEQVIMLKKTMDVMDQNKRMTIDLLPIDTKIRGL